MAALTATTSAPGATAAVSAAARPGAGCRSALVSTTTGAAPLSQASASSRSTRAGDTRPVNGSTTAAVSTLAASTCPSERAEAVDRTIALRRGSSAVSSGGSPVRGRSAPQSPTHTVRTGSGERTGVLTARTGPWSVTTSQRPRSTPVTRQGRSPAARWSAKAASNEAFQP